MFKYFGRPLNKFIVIFIIFSLFGASFIGISSGLDENVSEIDSFTSYLDSYNSPEQNMQFDDIGWNNDEDDTSELTYLKPKSKTAAISFPNFNIVNKDGFSRLSINGLDTIGSFGDPELPIKPLTFKFKPGTEIKNVKFTPGEIFTEQLVYPLNPVQEPIPVSDIDEVYSYGEPDPTPPNPKIYSSNQPFPNDWVDFDSGMGLDFETGLTTLFVNARTYPVRYIPADNQVIFTSDGILSIEYEEPTINLDPRAAPISEHYRLLIIGPEVFRQNLTRLATYKNNTGIPAKFVSITEIESDKYFPETGADTQEKIKYFIFNALKSWNITYVILGGDTPLVPHRNAYIHGEEGNTPSDLYYSDVYDVNMQFCDWNYDEDSIYGEYDNGNVDRADLYADVIIGRLPASSKNELEVLVNKIITYESFASGQPWFDNVTMCGTDTFAGTGTPEGEYSCEHIEENYLDGFTTTKIYETTTYDRDLACTSTNIVNTLNKGAGFATFHDHGAPTSWAGKFSLSNAANLKNGDKLPFLNFDACSTGYFDRSSGDSIAEVVMLNPNGGAITSIGASRLGYGQWGTAHITRYSGYFNVHLYDNYYNGEGTAGRIVESSKYDYLDNIGIHTFPDFKTIVEYTLFGDPSLSVGGIPLKNINISCENNVSYIEPSGSAEYKIKISNNGSFSRPIKLYVAGIPERWSANLNQSLIVVPGKGEYEVKLIVNASDIAVFQEIANIDVFAFYSKNMDRTISISTRSITSRIYGLDLNTTQLSDSVFPGEEASFWFRIYNKGNAFDTIKINATMQGEDELSGWYFNFSNNNLIVSPFDSQLITLKVSMPTMTLHGSYRVNISSEISGFSGENSKDFEFITVHVLRTYGLEFYSQEEISNSLIPGENFTYHLTVANLGNYMDKYQLSLLMFPPTWNISLSNTNQFEVEAFSSISEHLYFEIPKQTLVGRYTLKLRAQSIGNYSVLENLIFDIRINRTYGIDVDLDVIEVSGDPGEIKYFNLTIEHLGNSEDAVQVSIIDLPAKWYYNITRDIILEPFEVYTIPFEVSSHKLAENGSYNFQLKIKLMGNLMEYYLGMTYIVNSINGFEFHVNNNDFSVDAGGSQRYTFTLENLGNHWDEFEFNLSELPENWTAVWTPEDLQTESFELAPYRYTNIITIKISTDPMSVSNEYTIKISATLKSTGDTIDSYLTLNINPHYRISLDLDLEDLNLLVNPGEEFTVTINLTNHGNIRDQVTRLLFGIPDSWQMRSPRNYTFHLEPFQRRMELIRFEVPYEEYERDINLTINAKSQGDPSLTEVERSTITVEFERLPDDTDTSMDLLDFENIFEETFFLTICLPIVVLIIVVIIITILIIRQRRSFKREQEEIAREMEHIDRQEMDGQDYDDDYYEEAERLYGSKAVGSKSRPMGRGGRRIPPPPPEMRNRHKDADELSVTSTPKRMKKGRKTSKRALDEEHAESLCPKCGEFVSLDDDSCPYCGEIFSDGHDGRTRSHKKHKYSDDEEAEDWDADDEVEDWDQEEEEEEKDVDEDEWEEDEEESDYDEDDLEEDDEAEDIDWEL
jgi:uncharacterized membrane protein